MCLKGKQLSSIKEQILCENSLRYIINLKKWSLREMDHIAVDVD